MAIGCFDVFFFLQYGQIRFVLIFLFLCKHIGQGVAGGFFSLGGSHVQKARPSVTVFEPVTVRLEFPDTAALLFRSATWRSPLTITFSKSNTHFSIILMYYLTYIIIRQQNASNYKNTYLWQKLNKIYIIKHKVNKYK